MKPEEFSVRTERALWLRFVLGTILFRYDFWYSKWILQIAHLPHFCIEFFGYIFCYENESRLEFQFDTFMLHP